MKQWLSTLVKVVVAGGLIVWMIESGKLDLSQVARLLDPKFLAICFCLVFLNIFLAITRWWVLLRGQGFQTPYWDAFRLGFIGLFFNIAMPGGVGGDIIKGYYVVQEHAERKVAAAVTILMDRVVGLFGMVVLSGIALLSNLEFSLSQKAMMPLNMGIAGLFFFFLLVFGLGLSKRSKRFFHNIFAKLPMGSLFQKLHEALYSYRQSKRSLVMGVILSLVSQSFAVLVFVVVGQSMEPDVAWQAYFYVAPLGFIAMAAPIAPAGVGVGQAALYVLFNWYLGRDTDLGPTAITCYQVVSITMSLLGAIFYFQKKRVGLPKEVTL